VALLNLLLRFGWTLTLLAVTMLQNLLTRLL
jgi:hypothetical protein